jgi:hypothetical protein
LEIPILQWYLSEKIEEWVALVVKRRLIKIGLLVDKGEFLAGIHKHPRFRIEFYWDL